tara:strand:- start:1617 stop:2120 length:504 start_codon:yes stop_codon:yes gene_type:complete
MLGTLREKFGNSNIGKTAMAGALALSVALASFGPAANDAHAGEPQTASVPETTQTPVQMADEMDAYSQNPDTKGIGAFINLRKDSSVSGDDIGQWIRNQFAAVGVPVEYRVNQSRGSATDITLYAGGFDFTVNVAELEKKLPTIYAHHQDVWTPAKTASVNDAALTQ